MRRTILLLLIATLIPLTAAETTWNQTTTTLEPGNETTIGNINYTELSPSTSEQTSLSLGLPTAFETEVWNTTWSQTTDGAGNITGKSFYGEINVTVPHDYAPEENTVNSTITFGDNQRQFNFQTEYTVPRINNWTAQPDNLTGDFNVGEQGEIIGIVNATQQGNSPSVALNYNITGNATEIITDTEGGRTLYSGQSMPPITVQTDISEDQQWGEYIGTLNLTGEDGAYKEIPIDVNVTDVNPPNIASIDTPDIEATTEGNIQVAVDDNIETTKVNATFYRINNTGNTTSETEISTLDFETEDGSFWNAEFTDTENVSEIKMVVDAFDGSGNVQRKNQSFNVVKLDSINVTDDNFRFETKRVGDKALKQIIEVDTDTPFNLTLDYFQHSKENASISLGVRKNGTETDKNWEVDRDNPKIEFEESGTYILEAESEIPQSYQGTITVEHIGEHVEVEQIFFEGLFINPDYLEPREFSIGEFTGAIGYADPNATVKNRIRFEGTAPASNCENVEYWTDCITGFTLGEYEKIEDDRDEWKSKAKTRFWAIVGLIGFNIVFVFLMIRKNQLRGFNIAYKQVSYD